MEQLDQRGDAAGPASIAARAGCAAVATVLVAASAWVVWLRADNPDVEPDGNWWLVAWATVALAYGVTGAALLAAAHGGRRGIGTVFVVIGGGASLTALSIQYLGHELATGATDGGWLGDARTWSEPVTAGLIAAVVPWLVRPGSSALTRPAALVTGGLVGLTGVTAAFGGPAWLATALTWAVAVSAVAAIGALLTAWWPVRRGTDDPLPAWLAAGAIAAWLAFMPTLLSLGRWALTDNDVVAPVLVLATVPLLVGGAGVAAIRDSASPIVGLSHRTLEWAVLASGIVAIYTGVVVGLGSFIGGSGPTWLLVAATGAIALALEPVRRHIRWLVDHLVYGARDDPLAVVQRIVDHLGADAGDELLQGLVVSLQDELRLDAVAIELRVPDGWQPAASIGPPTPHRHVVPLSHRGELVGRLILGWEGRPALGERDERIFDQIAGPLSLAVGWAQLTDDLRRSSVAIVSAREEERRRLRRDLHDGLGPSLTGVSLGLRTVVGQLGRVPDNAAVDPSFGLLVRIADEVDTVVVDLKRIVRDLRPTALDQLGLIDAVAEFTRGFGDVVDVRLVLPPHAVELPAAVEVATYRIVTEAVTNVVRHARATHCWLTITTEPSVVIDVVDDGVGIGADDCRGVGITAMHERAAELGGSVHVLPNRPRGTRVHVLLPAALP